MSSLDMTDGEKSSFRVIVADDDGQIRRRMSDFLKDKGFEVEDVTNGKSLREKILAWKPHFIVVDLMLPDGNAIDIINFTKTQETIKDLNMKVLVTSGHNNAQNVR
ncbi:MAG: response regulator, partial [Bdellovibrionales bacterium]|nr:response regulator [Bdellovibrionales bacterium]